MIYSQLQGTHGNRPNFCRPAVNCDQSRFQFARGRKVMSDRELEMLHTWYVCDDSIKMQVPKLVLRASESIVRELSLFCIMYKESFHHQRRGRETVWMIGVQLNHTHDLGMNFGRLSSPHRPTVGYAPFSFLSVSLFCQDVRGNSAFFNLQNQLFG